jgi:hypothetical protein
MKNSLEQIKENPYLQFFIGLVAHQHSGPVYREMMAYFRKRRQESVMNDGNEWIVRHGLNVISSQTNDHNDDGNHGCRAARKSSVD